MSLYFNGCSFTYGDELVHPQVESWPSLVSSELQLSFCNDAVNGGTNERTVYKTMQNIDEYDCFFIAWTVYSRFTEYNPVDNFEINFTPGLNMNPSLHLSNDLKLNLWKYQDYGKLYYTHWYNELYEFKKWLHQIVLLQSFFKIHNKKYLMVNTFSNQLDKWLQPKEKFINSTRSLLTFFDHMNDYQLLQEHKHIQKLNNMIDRSTFVDWNHWSIQAVDPHCARGPNGHILKDGHREVAKKILEHYNKDL
jgi:hypothetical protein